MADSSFNFDEWAESLGLTSKAMSALTAEDYTNVAALKTLRIMKIVILINLTFFFFFF